MFGAVIRERPGRKHRHRVHYVLNRPAIDLLTSGAPQNLVMHDAWCYLVVSGCGRVVYDPRPTSCTASTGQCGGRWADTLG